MKSRSIKEHGTAQEEGIWCLCHPCSPVVDPVELNVPCGKRTQRLSAKTMAGTREAISCQVDPNEYKKNLVRSN
jgi:hypothetical protein